VPELPEVEVVRRGLERWVSGRTVQSVEVRHPRAVRRHTAGPADFAARLTGRRLGTARRRGKYLWIPVEDPLDPPGTPSPEQLTGHLGMSGQLLVQQPGTPDETHLRIRLRLAGDDTELRFVDQRTFGGMTVEAAVPGAADGLPVSVRHIARDPLDPAFDDAAFHTALRLRRTEIKRALLDQTLISGIGNIYADEALWRAGLHFLRPTQTMTRPRSAALLAESRAVMNAALAAGGTSFDSLYVNVNGQSGYFERSLDAYGREGLPCRRCTAPIRRAAFMNRSSYYCPSCQPKPRATRTGQVRLDAA
jgi:formamidopyrimidine-DNA glycosylase